MKHTASPVSVVVGIDGSTSATHAAEWAVDEAVTRDVPLRLLHVIQSTSSDIGRETAAAEAALRAAHDAVTETGQPVKIETVIARGPVAATLVAESVDAVMLCVGSAGAGQRASKFVGATGTSVAQAAHCPVAIIRNYGDTRWSESDDIAVVVPEFDAGAVLQMALDEARLRNATLLVLTLAQIRGSEALPDSVDRQLADALSRYPDVNIHSLLVPSDILTFLSQREPPVQLIVLGNDGGAAATRLVGPYGRFVLRDTDCSVLLAGG